MTHYRKTIGSLNYNTSNVPGAAETRVFIENDSNRYLYNPDEQTWARYHDFEGTPDLPAELLEALEAALLKHNQLRLESFSERKQWIKHIEALIADEDKIVETCTIYKGSYSINGIEPLDPHVISQHESEGTWVSYITEHSPNKVKHVRRRIRGDSQLSKSAETIRGELKEELKIERTAHQAGQNPLYHFEEAQQNPAGFDLNKRVTAVYQLAGFIHQTFRNHPDYPSGKPHWQYINQDGSLSSFESEVSALDVRKQLIENTQTHS